MVPMKSRKAPLEGMHSSMHSDSKATRKSGRKPRSFLEQRFRTLTGFEARPSHAFERTVAAEHARAMMSSAMREKRKRQRNVSKCCRGKRGQLGQ